MQRLDHFYFRITLVLEFLLIVLPVELVITLCNSQSHYFLGVTCCCIALVLGSALGRRKYQNAIKSTPFLNANMSDCSFLSYFRAYTNIVTGFSILAVDFVIFPGYFQKSDMYGTSLMDCGVGLYVISNAVVSAEARGITSTIRSVTKPKPSCGPPHIVQFSLTFLHFLYFRKRLEVT